MKKMHKTKKGAKVHHGAKKAKEGAADVAAKGAVSSAKAGEKDVEAV